MGEAVIRDKVMKEIKLIPENKLSEVYDLIHYFRKGLQKPKKKIDQITKFAGCWKDMPETIFKEFLEDIKQHRKRLFQIGKEMVPALVDTDILSLFFRDNNNVVSHFKKYLTQYKKVNLSIITYN